MAILSLTEQIYREIEALESASVEFYRLVHAAALDALQQANLHHDTNAIVRLFEQPVCAGFREPLTEWLEAHAPVYWTEAGRLRFLPRTEGGHDIDLESAASFVRFAAYLALPEAAEGSVEQ